MKRLMLLAALAAPLSMAQAEEAKEEALIDPSDLTRVYTQAAVFVTSDANIRTSTMATGAWTDDIQFAGFVEAYWGDRKNEDEFGMDYLNGRAQYFQVHGINNGVMPRIGFSTDFMHYSNVGAKDSKIAAFGAIGLINPKFTGGKLMLFPNLAYATGSMGGEDVDGYAANLYATLPIGGQGAFIQFSPEFLSLSGDTLNIDTMTYNGFISAPINKGRTQWLMTKISHKSETINGFNDEGDLTLEIGYKWFF
ncbi:hypothetical protein [Ferrimonas pelagia]|uniref:Nucleoside-specific outer membrane channel protein Tsx n=1 Tax=Ferrimonas pelagia TaxID=1177826 RepID=A0ABP9EKF5_9GAMM